MAKEYDWSTMLTTQEWADALKEIIADADKAAHAGNPSDLSSTMAKLREYIKNSPPKCEFLDDIAHGLLADLLVADMDATIEAIANRTADLDKQIAVINSVAGGAKKSAAQLRLEPVINQLEKAKDALETLKKEIEEKKEQGQELYTKVTGALAGIKAFLG